MLPFRYTDVTEALLYCVAATSAGEHLFPYSMTQYRTLLKSAEAALRAECGLGATQPARRLGL